MAFWRIVELTNRPGTGDPVNKYTGKRVIGNSSNENYILDKNDNFIKSEMGPSV